MGGLTTWRSIAMYRSGGIPEQKQQGTAGDGVRSLLGDKRDGVDLDACPKQKAGDLDCGRCGWIMGEDLAADLGEFGIGRKVREVDLDARDLVHVSVKLAQ